MQPTRPSDVKAWCHTHNFHPNRTLGQNFLIDGNILNSIVAAAELPPHAQVLEVGPGLGVLTKALLDAGVKVTAIEKDHRLANWLSTSIGNHTETLQLIESDMLNVSLDALLIDPKSNKSRFHACVSNLPYSVGTRILLELCRHSAGPDIVVVTVQREVAQRLVASENTSERGLAGVWVQQNFDVTLLRTIKPSCFWPRPEISSSLIRLVRHNRHPLTDLERQAFDRLTRHAFSHRRKQMVASLRMAPPSLGLTPDQVEPFLATAGLDPRIRAENISNEAWATLARTLAALAPSTEIF